MVKVNWSNTARYDLRQIYEYISKDSDYYAKQVVREIIIKSESLMDFPNIGRVVPELDDDSIREIFIYSYRLVYQLSSPNEIQVLALIHSKRQFAINDRDV